MKKNKLIILFLALGLGFAFVSCDNDTEPIYSSYALFTKQADNDYKITLDNGDDVKVVDDLDVSKLEDSTRLSMSFHIIAQTENSMELDILWLDTLLTKHYLEYDEEILDSVGNDPVKVHDVWFSHDYLNMTISYMFNSKSHMLNLLKLETTEDNTLSFDFRHNAFDDAGYSWKRTTVSFKIQDLLAGLEKPAKIKLKYHDSDNSARTVTIKYE